MMKRALVLFILFSIISSTVSAQAPETGRIALYVDSLRTVNEVDLPAPYTSFDIYIFCQPSENGMYCAEFAMESSNESMIVAINQWHPGLSVILGDMTTGVSACFLECQTDWVVVNRVSMLNSNIDPATMNIVRHPDVGYYQFASCLPGSPIEPVFNGPGVYVNSEYTPDTDPPVPVSVSIEDDMRITLIFDEKVFEPDAIDLDSYLLTSMDAAPDTIPVNFAQMQPGDDRVWMVLGGHLWDVPFRMEVLGVRDITGNVSEPGAHIVFQGFDETPPTVEQVYSPDNTTVVVVYSEPVTEASAENLSNYSFSCSGIGCVGEPDATSAALHHDGRTVTITVAAPLAQEAEYVITIEDISDLSGNVMGGYVQWPFAPPDTFPPYVVSVTTAADTSLMILWNETVDMATSEDLANYSFIEDGPPSVPMILHSADNISGLRVRLNFEPPLVIDTEYTLYVSGVLDMTMNEMNPDTIDFTPFDSIPPVLVSAVCIGNQIVDLTFSEPVDPAVVDWYTHFQIYPVGNIQGVMTLADISMAGDPNMVRIQTLFGMTPGADYTARALAIPDLSGNAIPVQQVDFTCYDVFPPEVMEIYTPDLTHIYFRFNEAVNDAAGEPGSYVLYEAADTSALVEITAAVLYGEDDRVELTTLSSLTEGETYALRMIGIGDLLGNMIDPDTTAIFTAEDTVAPVLLGVSVTSDSIVHLEFDEPLNPMTAQDIANYAVVEAADTSVMLPLQAASLDVGGTIVDLEIDGHGVIGTSYIARIMGVMDVTGNAAWTASSPFQFIDDHPPRLLSVVGASARNVLVFFDEVITDATARDRNNYTLYPTGAPTSEVYIFQANRLLDQKSVNLVLGEDLVQDTDYTLEVSGIMDPAGYTMDPDTAEFHFLDVHSPVILNVDLLNPTRLSIRFNEPVDSATASDTGNYSIYLTANSSELIPVTSIDWMTDEVRLNLAFEPQPNVNYTVRIEGIEDRFGNVSDVLFGAFRYDVYEPSTKLYLFADEGRSSHEVDVDLYQPFRIYVWAEPGSNGIYAVEYALSVPETYIMAGLELNPDYSAAAIGDPYNGHSVALSACAHDWFWVCYIDCICLIPDVQEVVWFRPHPDVGVIHVATCLPDHPLEPVVATYPMLINAVYIGTMLDSWDVSFGHSGIELNWSVLDSGEVPEFEVLRTPEGVEAWQQLDSGLIRGDGLRYSLFDSNLEFGLSYRYRVEYPGDDGPKVLFETDAVSTPVMPLTLRQNSPNPFNPATSIAFHLPQPGHVRLEIFDVNGRQIDVLADGQYASGEHSVDWDGRDRTGSMVTSGVYFYRLIAGKESLSRKMVLLR